MQQQIKVSGYRYVNLVLFLLAGCTNSFAAQAFSAVGPLIRDMYGVSELEVNLNGISYSIMYPLVLLPTNFILETYGLKVGTLIGEMFICLGLLLRLLINQGFHWFLTGTFITGLGFCFMINAPNKFVVNWFPVRQIVIMNSLCIFSIFMSDSLGTFASALFIDSHSTKEDVFQFFAVESAVVIGILLLMAVFFKGAPENPPNYAAQVQRQDYLKSLKTLVSNKNYMKLFGSVTFIFGALNIFFVCLSWVLDTYKFEAIQAGIIFITANLSGLLGCVVVGALSSSRNHRRTCIVCLYMCIVALGVMVLGMEMHQPWVLYVGAGLFGFHIFPYLTSVTDFGSETAFPVGEAISGGSLLFGGQVLGVVMSLLMSELFFNGKDRFKTHVGLAIIFCIMGLGVAFVHWSKSLLARTDYQNRKANNRTSLLNQASQITS